MSDVEKPKIGTKEWQDYVLSHIDAEDLKDGKPTAAGLRKFTEREYAWIQSIDSSVIASNYKTATVKVTVFAWNQDGKRLEFSACVEANEHNMPEQFHHHAVAAAETKALSRALKNMLCLNIYTHEELEQSNNYVPTISDRQVRAMISIASERGIDLNKFLAEHAGISASNLTEGDAAITKDKAHELINTLTTMKVK